LGHIKLFHFCDLRLPGSWPILAVVKSYYISDTFAGHIIA
jgi:hypothetical protein